VIARALTAEAITKRYGDLVAVDALSLTAAPGEVLAMVGPNGAGKTTTLDMLAGTTRPDSGEVRWQGRSIGPEQLRQLVGLSPQSTQLWPRLTCIEQLLYLASLFGLARTRGLDVAERLLDRVGLAAQRDTQARRLSGGMQRRLNIALALVSDPDVVVLDEPEAGLDPQSRVLARELIVELAAERIVIVTSHDLAEVERVADRVIILDHGRAIAEGRPGDLLRSAQLAPALEFTTTSGAAAGLAAALATVTGADRVQMDAGLVTVRLLPGGQLEALLSAAVRSGAALTAVQTRDSSLEDLFLQLTGRSLRE
jgi:ABC-2 type transport system ATP-binding protein